MRKFVLLTLLSFMPLTAFAATDAEVVQAFNASAEVATLVTQARVDNNVAAQPDVALLGGGCGFAGCSSSYLVTLAVMSRGPNTQTRVISAVVKVDPFGSPAVKVVSISSLL